MLHPNAKARLMRLLDEEIEIAWHNPATDESITATVGVDRRWASQDSGYDYPAVTLTCSPDGVQRGHFGDDYADSIYKDRDVLGDDEAMAYRKYTVSPMETTATITVSVASSAEGENADGEPRTVPKHVVADSLTWEVFYSFKYDWDHLTDHGTDGDGELVDYAWPMKVYQLSGEGVVDTSATFDEQALARRQFQFSVEYLYWEVEDVEAVDEIEYELGVDVDRDYEIDTEYGPFIVDI